jgi:hypothetical protein
MPSKEMLCKLKERNKDCDKSSLSVPNAERNARRVVAAS